MAGEEAQLKGLSKYFNSITFSGRKNTAMATYGVVGLVILYQLVKPKKK